MIARALALVLLVGCYVPPNGTQPGAANPTDCTAIADRLYAQSAKDDRARIARDAEEHYCRVDGWSDRARSCLATASATAGNCGTYLTDVQNAHLAGALQQAANTPTGCASYHVPSGCIAYCQELEILSRCDKLPRQTRDALAGQWTSVATQFSQIPESSWPQIESGCLQGAASIRQVGASQGCSDGG